MCGLLIIDLHKGAIVEYLKLEGIVRELYDVAVMPDIKLPLLIGTRKEEIKRFISIEL